MNKIIDIIFKDIKKDKNIYISLIIVLLISLVFGIFFITILTTEDKTLLKSHINTYFDTIKSGSTSLNLYNNLVSNNIGIFILWILGFSIIGLPLIIAILFYKGFSLSFTITSLIYNFRLDGIFFSFIYVFPHLILNLLFYFIVTYYSFKMCINLIWIISGKSKFNFRTLKKYLFILVISLFFISLSSLYETYILPYLIKIIY